MIFLDAAATTPVRREVLEAMWPYLSGEFGNPSSHHTLGEAAASALADARAAVAKVLGCRTGEITFTSGGTEADNLAVKGIALARQAADSSLNRVVISAVEHPAVEESARYLARFHGFTVDVASVDAAGRVTPEALAAVLRPETAVVSVMYANNEVGTVQPVAQLAAMAAEQGIPFHTDAVQAAGWLPLDVKVLGVDALSISGHKLGAPKGSGVLYVRGRTRIEPLVHGGGQERGRRSGTENVAGAVALGTALTLAHAERVDEAAGVAGLRDRFIASVLGAVPGALLTGHPTERLPSVASFCFPGTSGESVLLELERQGVVCSSGSACAAGSDAPSPVLTALGYAPEVAQTAVRFSFTSAVTADQLEQAGAAVAAAVGSVRSLGRTCRPGRIERHSPHESPSVQFAHRDLYRQPVGRAWQRAGPCLVVRTGRVVGKVEVEDKLGFRPRTPHSVERALDAVQEVPPGPVASAGLAGRRVPERHENPAAVAVQLPNAELAHLRKVKRAQPDKADHAVGSGLHAHLPAGTFEGQRHVKAVDRVIVGGFQTGKPVLVRRGEG